MKTLSDIQMPFALEDAMRKAAAERNVPLALLRVVAWIESRGDCQAVGQAGELGAFQFMPATWAEWSGRIGVRDPRDCDESAQAAAAFLSSLLDQVERRNGGVIDLLAVIAAYNAGYGGLTTYARGTQGARFPEPGWRERLPEITQRYLVTAEELLFGGGAAEGGSDVVRGGSAARPSPLGPGELIASSSAGSVLPLVLAVLAVAVVASKA